MFFGFKKISQTQNKDTTSYSIKIDNELLSEVEYTKFLGVFIDKKFTWQQHVSYICSKISKTMYVLNRLKYILNKHSLLYIYFSLIYPHLNYCNIIWGCASKSVLNQLLLLQKRAIRIICHAKYLAHTDELAQKIHLLKLPHINIFQSAMFMYKYLNRNLPCVCKDFLAVNDPSTNVYNLRQFNNFAVPPFRTLLRKRCLLIRGPKIWNLIPCEIKSSPSLSSFKRKLRTYLLSNISSISIE